MKNKKLWIGLGIGFGVIILFGIILISSVFGYYNKFVTSNELIESTWAQVENVLQRRADLIPNLVSTVKGIAKQEKDVFIKVAEARSRVGGAQTRAEKIGANQQLTGALSRLLLVVERYPELKSNKNFLALQSQLEGTENRIAVERKRYNESVRNYNIVVKRVPGRFLAGIFGFGERDEYFDVAEEAKKVPKVEF